MRSRALQLVLLASLILSAAPLFAWGEKGHAIVSEAATLALPTDMPGFFYRAFSQLVWGGDDPDRWKGAGVSLDDANTPDHFLDFEYVEGLRLPPERYKAADLFHKSGVLRRHGLVTSTIGFLPWRIAELSERLTNEWRQWRFSLPGSPERRFIEADIVRDAAVLGHFVGDASNPQHATINFNGWVERNPEHFATDCEVHTRFERDFVDHALTTAIVEPHVASTPALRTDYFAAAMAELTDSHQNLPTLYRIDRDGGLDPFKPLSAEAVEFTAERLATGAATLRDLWWSTWVNSAKRPKRQEPPPD